MTDPTHPDDDDDIERVVERVLSAHHLAEPDVRNRAWCNCQPWDTKDKPFLPAEHVKHLAQQIAAAVAVPPAAGPDDVLRAVREVHARYFDLDVDPAEAQPEPEDIWRYDRDIRAVLAAVPSAGLPTPPEAAVSHQEGEDLWAWRSWFVVEAAEPAVYLSVHTLDRLDMNPAEARLLAATLLAAADVAEGGAR